MASTSLSDADVALTWGRERPRRSTTEWMDRLAGSDPGLNRLRQALQTTISIAASLGAGWLFVHLTHALQIQTQGVRLPPAQAATVAAANHELLVVGELVATIVAMISTFGVADPDVRGQIVSSLLVPVPMVATLALGLAVGDHRVPSLVLLVVVMTVGTYLRRFGPRGFLAGILLFMGFFLGFFLHAAVHLSDLGWLTAEVGVGVLVTLAIRLLFFYPHPAKALQRTQRSYAARARTVIRLSLGVLDGEAKAEPRLTRALARLNETALMVDAQLADPDALAGRLAARRLHELLYDAELSLTNVARFAQAIAYLDLPAAERASARAALAELAEDRSQGAREAANGLLAQLRAADEARAPDPGADQAAVVIPHRFAGSVIAFADALDAWMAQGSAESDREAGEAFQPAAQLFFGWLPGSSPASAATSLEPGPRWWERLAMPPYVRAAIQMGAAVTLAIAVGVQISGYRFYWAVLAAFVTLMGTNNSGEQVLKAIYRVAGTVVGIAIGSVAAHLVGHHSNYSIAVILVSLFLGLYLMRINYAFMVVGITVMVSQLYVQLGEYTNHLLILRLIETAAGAVLAILTVTAVFPLRTRRVLRVAVRDHVRAVAELVRDATTRLLDPDATVSLHAAGRKLDSAYQTLLATLQPLRRNLFGDLDHQAAQALSFANASRNYARNLIGDVGAARHLDDETRAAIELGSRTLGESMDVLLGAIDGPRDGTYTRSAALFDQAERRLEADDAPAGPARLVIRDLKLLDATLALMAAEMNLRVANYDTAAVLLTPEST